MKIFSWLALFALLSALANLKKSEADYKQLMCSITYVNSPVPNLICFLRLQMHRRTLGFFQLTVFLCRGGMGCWQVCLDGAVYELLPRSVCCRALCINPNLDQRVVLCSQLHFSHSWEFCGMLVECIILGASAAGVLQIDSAGTERKNGKRCCWGTSWTPALALVAGFFPRFSRNAFYLQPYSSWL